MSISKNKSLAYLSLLVVISLLTVNIQAQTTVTFQVYVEPELLVEGTQVLVLGSDPAIGNWGSEGEVILTPHAEQPNVYTGQTTIQSSEVPIEYKYVLRSKEQDIWERAQLGNRRFWTEDQSQTLPLALFDEHAGLGIRQTFLTVQLELDLNAFYLDEDEIEAVAVLGGRNPLSFDLTNPLLMNKLPGGNRWNASFTVSYGAAKDLPIKFAWKVDGAWEWEWLPGHTVHALLLDDSKQQQQVRIVYNPETRTLGPDAGSVAWVDNWTGIFATQGKLAPHSKYRYEQSIALMEVGNSEQAETVYADFEQRYAGGDEVNDYYYRKAEHLYEAGDSTAALNLLESRHQVERDPYRKAYYRYRQAELMLLNGHHLEARKRLEQIERDYSEHRRLVEYARIGQASSLISEPSDSAAVHKGIALLKQINTQELDGSSTLAFISPRVVQRQLARAHGYMGQTTQQKEIIRRMAYSGTDRQQMQARIALAKLEEETNNEEEALRILESINEQVLSQRGKKRLHAEYIEQLWKQGYTEEVIERVGQLRSRWPEHTRLRRMEHLEQEAIQQKERGDGNPRGRRDRSISVRETTQSRQAGTDSTRTRGNN